MSQTLITRIANFTCELEWSSFPEKTRTLARAQLLGWMGSLAAGWIDDATPGVLAVSKLLGGSGQAAVWPHAASSMGSFGAAYASAVLTCSQEYDDYLFLAHTGHSACGAGWVIAQTTDATVREVLQAQVAANEIMGRLGAACLVGPQNGQMWTFVHLAGAVLTACRLRGRDAELAARALSIAFSRPPFELMGGFGSASSKRLSAATPTLLGLLAVEQAERGLTGDLGVLEQPGGFFDRFAFVPLLEVFDDLGRGFVTDTVSIKPLPGCAYVTAPALGALSCVRQHADEKARPFDADEIERVEVLAGPMTMAMQRMVGDHFQGPPYSPVNVHFSVPLTLACALLQGRLDPDDLTEQSLRAHAEPMSQIATRVILKSDPRLTRDLVRHLGFGAGLLGMMRRQGLTRLAPALIRLAGMMGRGRASGSHPSRRLAPALEPLGDLVKTSLGRIRDRSQRAYDFAFPFGATVVVTTTGGDRYEAQVAVPDGAAGCGSEAILEVARAKFCREHARFFSLDWAQRFARRLLEGEMDDFPVAELVLEASEATIRQPVSLSS